MGDDRREPKGAVMTAAIAQTTPPNRVQLGRRAQLLAGASVGYNLIEAVVAIAAGAAAGSIALVGFGLDSAVEMSSGVVILWQFRRQLPETRERHALRLISISFFALAAYVAVESLHSLLDGGQAATSSVGIALAASSLVVMPVLSLAQRRTGRALGSGSVVADSKQTLLCTYLSAGLLVGLMLNATLGWSWADPLVGLMIATVAVREGRAAWRGEACGCGPTGLAAEAALTGPGRDDGCSDACCSHPIDGSSAMQLSVEPTDVAPSPGSGAADDRGDRWQHRRDGEGHHARGCRGRYEEPEADE
jgi:Cation efflux family